MGDRLTWIEFQGKKILYTDYSNLSSEQALELLYALDKLIAAQEMPVTMLSNYEGTKLNKQLYDETLSSASKNHKLVAKSANLGFVGSPRAIVNTTFSKEVKEMNHRTFETKEEALLWLVE